MAADGFYETVAEVIEVHPTQRMIKTDAGDILRWHEFWQEQL
jgi:hypothetical protein